MIDFLLAILFLSFYFAYQLMLRSQKTKRQQQRQETKPLSKSVKARAKTLKKELYSLPQEDNKVARVLRRKKTKNLKQILKRLDSPRDIFFIHEVFKPKHDL